MGGEIYVLFSTKLANHLRVSLGTCTLSQTFAGEHDNCEKISEGCIGRKGIEQNLVRETSSQMELRILPWPVFCHGPLGPEHQWTINLAPSSKRL